MESVIRKAKNQGSMSNDEWDLLDKKALPIVAFNITKVKTIE